MMAAAKQPRDVEPMRIAVWGMGRVFARSLPQLRRAVDGGAVLAALVDANPQQASPFEGVPVLAPDELDPGDIGLVIIMSSKSHKEIAAQAAELGFDRSSLVSHRILDIPGFDMQRYLQLRRQGMSIASNGSWGEVMSRLLKVENRSPFEGTFIPDADYLRMAADLKRYLSIDEPLYVGERIGPYGNLYHCFLFDDVQVRMDGGRTAQEALAQWRRGCEGFDFDRALVELHTLDPAAERVFNALVAVPNRICLVPYETDEPCSATVLIDEGLHSFSHAVVESAWRGHPEISIDLVDRLLGSSAPSTAQSLDHSEGGR